MLSPYGRNQYMHRYIGICVYVYTYICRCTYVNICMHVYAYVYMYMCISIFASHTAQPHGACGQKQRELLALARDPPRLKDTERSH